MSVFVHAQCNKTCSRKGEFKKWQNSVHVVVECPLLNSLLYAHFGSGKNRVTQNSKDSTNSKIPHLVSGLS